MAKIKSSDKKIILEATLRTVFGKKLRKFRHEGNLPANVYGPDFKSVSVTVGYRNFINTYKQAKETAVVYLKMTDGEIPALISNLQKHPVTDSVLHVDFRKVDLTKKVIAEVPVKFIGESEAVKIKGGVLLTQSNHLAVECLPQDMPQTIDIDISLIKDIGQDIKVADIKENSKYLIKEEPTKVIVSVIQHKEESITPETTAAAAPEVITEKAPAEGEAVVETAGKETKAPAGKQPPAPVASKGDKKESKKEGK